LLLLGKLVALELIQGCVGLAQQVQGAELFMSHLLADFAHGKAHVNQHPVARF